LVDCWPPCAAVIDSRDRIRFLGQRALERRKYAYIERLEHMRGVRWQCERVDSVLHAMCYHVRADVTSVTVHDEKAMECWVSWSGRGLENSSQPLVGVAVRRPAAVARRETPVSIQKSF
jgi:hypothetical protein